MIISGKEEVEASVSDSGGEGIGAFEGRVTGVGWFSGEGKFEISDSEVSFFDDGSDKFEAGVVVVFFIGDNFGGVDLRFMAHDIAGEEEGDGSGLCVQYEG